MRRRRRGAKQLRMNLTINRLKWIFLGLFAVACAGIWIYHLLWVWPGDRCEAAERWWDGATRTCAQPIYIPDITGRQPGESREAASMRTAAERAAQDRQARGEPPAISPPQPDQPAGAE